MSRLQGGNVEATRQETILRIWIARLYGKFLQEKWNDMETKEKTITYHGAGHGL